MTEINVLPGCHEHSHDDDEGVQFWLRPAITVGELAALRMKLKEAQAERNVAQGKLDDLREMALELKRQYASYRYADSVGCAVEWQGEYGEDYRKLESNIMERLIGR